MRSAFRLRRLAQNVGTGFGSSEVQRSRFTSAPCSFFALCPFHVADVALSGHFEVENFALLDGWQDIGRFFIRMAGMALSARATTLASIGQNERWFWRSFCVAGTVFGEL